MSKFLTMNKLILSILTRGSARGNITLVWDGAVAHICPAEVSLNPGPLLCDSTSDLPDVASGLRAIGVSGILHQHYKCQKHTEKGAKQSCWATTGPGSISVIGGGGLNHRSLSFALAVPQVSSHAGSVGHGMGDVVLLLDTLKQVGHGSTCEHCHILPAVCGGLSGDSSQLDIVFRFWTQQNNFQ